MTRLWLEGQLIAVLLNERAQPDAFTWQGQQHQVEHITRQWRVDGDWWCERVWRNYYKLHTDTGLLLILYQDLLSGQWFLQRLYD
jgi:hypothetical protein